MPDPQPTEAPIPEPLELRLLRDLLTNYGTPLICRRRQCRRNRQCSGAAQSDGRPSTSGLWLPPCATHAKPESHLELLTMAGRLRPHVAPCNAPRQWPEDEEAAVQLRVALAQIYRIHSRPGPHPESEQRAVAEWQATDPAPAITARYRRSFHHSRPEKRPSARPGTTA
jgi:hypothetical protein